MTKYQEPGSIVQSSPPFLVMHPQFHTKTHIHHRRTHTLIKWSYHPIVLNQGEIPLVEKAGFRLYG